MSQDKKPYQSGPASLFSAHARHIKEEEDTPLPLYCYNCKRHSMEFVEDDGNFENYHCNRCGLDRQVAVR